MSKFKTPAQLGLTQEQFNALVMVSGKLARGELRHISAERTYLYLHHGEKQPNSENLFNMDRWGARPDAGTANEECGSVCCIGGWAERLSGLSFSDEKKLPPELGNLFFPRRHSSWGDFTTQDAARALCHYLTTGADGNSCWDEALKSR